MIVIREEGSEVQTTITKNGMFIEHLCKAAAFQFDMKDSIQIANAILKIANEETP